ncbi:Arabinogalactan protein 16/20/22/41 [Dioscorea alata]|uniref:Arabinogalactan protein 16/20/22/41 n=1 Tax=Dioscorea alata TaxID=55571 RepID=A0ACB7TUL1_DIOAL|nr:Arabinogalactan protein 16/20/22/41 [Dioscorea alata]
MSSMKVYAMIFITFFLSGLMQISLAQATTASSRMVDGKAIDQGIAYVLMLVALLVTYLIH